MIKAVSVGEAAFIIDMIQRLVQLHLLQEFHAAVDVAEHNLVSVVVEAVELELLELELEPELLDETAFHLAVSVMSVETVLAKS